MAITITATDVNNDGTGVNLLSYLDNFEATFVATGRGQFSAANGISGAQYLASDASSNSVVFTALSSAPWSYSLTTHTVSGSLDAVTFGTGTALDSATRTFTQTTELSISGLNITDSTTAETIRGQVTAHSVDDLLSYLASDSLNFVGSTGNDVFKGYDHNDRFSGGNGNDSLWGYGGNDIIYGGNGNDTLVGGSGDDKLYGQNGDDKLKGGTGNDVLQGGTGNDALYGEAGNDKLYGEAGNDTLDGGAGDDRLYGGSGADKLTGGAGKDTFVFTSKLDSKVAASGRDTITDFSHSDKIDLSAIDASTKKAGNQAFTFIGSDDFGKHAGELRYEKAAGGGVDIYGDLNGDGKADFAIHLTKAITLTAGDFLL